MIYDISINSFQSEQTRMETKPIGKINNYFEIEFGFQPIYKTLLSFVNCHHKFILSIGERMHESFWNIENIY